MIELEKLKISIGVLKHEHNVFEKKIMNFGVELKNAQIMAEMIYNLNKEREELIKRLYKIEKKIGLENEENIDGWGQTI